MFFKFPTTPSIRDMRAIHLLAHHCPGLAFCLSLMALKVQSSVGDRQRLCVRKLPPQRNQECFLEIETSATSPRNGLELCRAVGGVSS